jgi:uracil-xanthine permease
MAKNNKSVVDSDELIYQLDGRPPLRKAIPLGLQHVLAMFTGNLAPIFVLTGLLGTSAADRIIMIQCAMLVSGLITFLQLYPIKIGKFQLGAKLPIVMGTAFAFVPTMQAMGDKLHGEGLSPEVAMGFILGACLLGGFVEVVMGIFIKPLKKFFPPLVVGSVLVTIGIKLLSTGATYFIGSPKTPNDFDPKNLVLGFAVFLTILLVNKFAKGVWKASSILVGLVVGYVLAMFMGMVNLSTITNASWVSMPAPFHFKLAFRMDIIVAFFAVYVVSGLETIGNTSGITIASLNRDATAEETSGAILADAIGSQIAAIFNTLPNTAFGQNAGIVAMTGVINRFCIATGAAVLVLAGFFPKIGAIFSAMPNSVLGGAVITVFAMILLNGIKMIASAGFNDMNNLIVGITFGLGYGVGNLAPAIKAKFPVILQYIFQEPVAAVCIVSVIACLIFKPKQAVNVSVSA